MNVYGNTCPMCCGDLDDVAYLRTGDAVCQSCGCNVEAPASTRSTSRRPEATAFGVSSIAMRDPVMTQAPADWISLSPDIQAQTSAPIVRTESTTH